MPQPPLPRSVLCLNPRGALDLQLEASAVRFLTRVAGVRGGGGADEDDGVTLVHPLRQLGVGCVAKAEGERVVVAAHSAWCQPRSAWLAPH